jgi:hypothetical protein
LMTDGARLASDITAIAKIAAPSQSTNSTLIVQPWWAQTRSGPMG